MHMPGLISPHHCICAMDINFHDPSDIPLPAKEVRIRKLRVEPLPDQKRVRIFLEITPFQQKPNCEIKIFSDSGDEVASLSIIEAIDYKMQFTVHLKDQVPGGSYTASLDVYYFEADEDTQDRGSHSQGEFHQLPERIISVDKSQVSFTIVQNQPSE